MTEVKAIEQKPELVVVEQITQQPTQPLPERDADWFLWFDAIRAEAVIVPPGISFTALFASPFNPHLS